MKKRESILLLSLCVSLISGCGLFSKNDATNGTPSTAATVCSVGDPSYRESFKTSLHPSLQKACYECHNSQSPKAPSPFADDSPSVAMESAKRFVDFNAPGNSAFVKRMEQGHNCGSNCGALGAEFSEKITEWKSSLKGNVSQLNEDCSALKDGDDAKVIRTVARRIDKSVTDASTTLVFDLKDATPPLPGVAFQVRVSTYTPQTYIIDRPVLASQPLTSNSEQNVRVSNIHLFVNGTENPLYRNFVSTDFILQPRPFPQGTEIFGWYIVKDASQIVNWSGSSEEISFELKISVTNLLWNVPKTDPFKCNRVDLFTTFYNMKRGTCLDCHDSGGGGYAFFPMKPQADAEVCRNFKMRSNPVTPLKSLFYLMPQNMISGYTHPVTIPFTAAEETAISNWLATEK